jgi:uncharacterized protein YecE (DUF72 family)
MKYRTGCSGWSYDFWRGKIYDFREAPGNFLKIYSKLFDTVEIDSTFYAAQGPDTVNKWYSSVPDDFVFSPKMPRKITHELKLQNCEVDLGFFLRNISLLREKLGMTLIQLPPDFACSVGVLENFIETLPEDMKFAVEFRHSSWFRDDVYSLLKKFNITMAWPVLDYIRPPEVRTASNLYVRFLGNKSLTKDMLGETRINRHKEIDIWTEKIIENSFGMDTVYIYANNHYEGFSPVTLKYIRNRLGLSENIATLGDRQKKLF